MGAPGPIADRPTPSALVETACDRLFERSQAARYGLSRKDFGVILLSIAKQYCAEAVEAELVRFLESLKLEELALARGCAAGNELAWETFLTRYRSSLYGAAYSIAKEESVAKELADSLYAELYGIPNEAGRRVSKLEYYKGRGSLEGWLRTVLAQEFVNRYRRTKREVSLEEKVEAGEQFAATPPAASGSTEPALEQASSKALRELGAEERFMLAAYFLDGRTLAELGRTLKVHESTISRKLDRLTSDLRKTIRKDLIGQGISSRRADELMQELDVRDLTLDVRGNLQQEPGSAAFYKRNEE